MQELIKISKSKIGNDEINSVNARELWSYLESKRKFADWIKDKLEGFVENSDFITISQKCENSIRARIEYIITIDTAKHMAMMEKNDKGYQIRQYFIDVEKEHNQSLDLPQTMPEALRRLANQIEENERLNIQIEEQKPQVEFAQRVSESTKLLSVGEFAKILGTGQNRLFEFLRKQDILIAKKGDQYNLPKQHYLDNGYFIVREKEYNNITFLHSQTYITGKGQLYIQKLWDANNNVQKLWG